MAQPSTGMAQPSTGMAPPPSTGMAPPPTGAGVATPLSPVQFPYGQAGQPSGVASQLQSTSTSMSGSSGQDYQQPSPADYQASLPQGIPSSQIPPGQEDMYILKSQIVPPGCPACPTSCPVKGDPPPCPPCARCPEPGYRCKLVPAFSAGANFPRPILNDFSQFGM